MPAINKMDAKEFEKNKLDLLYQKNLQKLNAVLAFGTVGAITILAAYVTNPIALWQTFTIIAVILFGAAIFYKNINRDLDSLIGKIEKLK